MQARTVKLWSRIHTWSSLVCTVFLLLLCLTGLPLIFADEIEQLAGGAVQPAAMPAGTPPADLDQVVRTAEARRQGEHPQYLIWPRDEANVVLLSMAASPTAPPAALHGVRVDARTALVLDEPGSGEGFLYWMLRLHADLFLGLPGKLFLGAMGLVFVLAVVSGVVLYAPFTRRLRFGTVRRDHARRTRWLDLHNLLGIATLCWVLVVGVTGVVNAGADLVLTAWRNGQLADMVAPWKGTPPVAAPGSVARAVAAARAAAPGMTPFFVAYPQTPFSSAHHYAVFMRGDTPLTSRVLVPALVDAGTGALTDMRRMPWYAEALFVSQPLHFGDYGGLPLKLLWAALDFATVVVLASGLYLWAARTRFGLRPRPVPLRGSPAA